MQKALFEPGTPVFIYRLFQFATIGLLILLIILYSQGTYIHIQKKYIHLVYLNIYILTISTYLGLGNQHIYILGALTFCLFSLVTWIVSEVGLEAEKKEEEENTKKSK